MSFLIELNVYIDYFAVSNHVDFDGAAADVHAKNTVGAIDDFDIDAQIIVWFLLVLLMHIYI